MTSRLLTAAVAALSLGVAMAPAVDAFAQNHHGGGGHGGGGHSGGGHGGYHGGGGGYHGGGYHHGGGYGAGGALLAGIAVGSALGYYGGHPYYCRDHHHWRWSHRLGRYVYDYRAYC